MYTHKICYHREIRKKIYLNKSLNTSFIWSYVIKELSISLLAPDKRRYPQNNFLYLHKNICCGYSLEAPHRGTSNEYPQHMFSWRNKKNITTFCLKKKNKTKKNTLPAATCMSLPAYHCLH